jgi:hypothetical protein
MTDRQLMQQALDALEGLADYRYTERVKETMSALRERLAQPEQEPVAWASRAFDPDDGHYGKWGTWKISDYKPPRQPSKWFQVVSLPHTTPPQRKPLSDDLYNELLFAVARVHPNETRHQTALRYIQQAESGGVDQCTAAHNIKEKNNGN